MSKIVYKYGTGQEIPSNAKYLCTQTETLEETCLGGTLTKNLLVWHYYELPLPGPQGLIAEDREVNHDPT